MEAFLLLLFVAAPVGISIYFRSRREVPPTKVERRVAIIWLALRRIVCFGAAAILLAVACVVAYSMIRGPATGTGILGTALAVSVACIFAHWGMYGTGYRRYDVTDDKPVHEWRKKRYGWPW